MRCADARFREDCDGEEEEASSSSSSPRRTSVSEDQRPALARRGARGRSRLHEQARPPRRAAGLPAAEGQFMLAGRLAPAAGSGAWRASRTVRLAALASGPLSRNRSPAGERPWLTTGTHVSRSACPGVTGGRGDARGRSEHPTDRKHRTTPPPPPDASSEHRKRLLNRPVGGHQIRPRRRAKK